MPPKARINWPIIFVWIGLFAFWCLFFLALLWPVKAQTALKQQQIDGLPIVFSIGFNTADNTVFVDDAIIPFYSIGTGAPNFPCHPGRDFYVDQTAGRLYICPAENAWKAVN